MCLKELQTPKAIADVAVILDTTYNYAFTKLQVFVARGWVLKIGFGKKKKYHLNQDEIQIEYPKSAEELQTRVENDSRENNLN
jgi:hypothetical protein